MLLVLVGPEGMYFGNYSLLQPMASSIMTIQPLTLRVDFEPLKVLWPLNSRDNFGHVRFERTTFKRIAARNSARLTSSVGRPAHIAALDFVPITKLPQQGRRSGIHVRCCFRSHAHVPVFRASALHISVGVRRSSVRAPTSCHRDRVTMPRSDDTDTQCIKSLVT